MLLAFAVTLKPAAQQMIAHSYSTWPNTSGERRRLFLHHPNNAHLVVHLPLTQMEIYY
jgi:hypothetical protein